jgi:cysteine desulfuration protein SufE
MDAKIQNLKSEFEMLDNPMDKYQHIIDLGKSKEAVSQDIRHSDNLIKGCVSQAWMSVKLKDNLVIIATDSDALIVKGLLKILERLVNESKVEDVKKLDGSKILRDIGLGYSISSQRTNGFVGAINKIKSEF